MKVGIVGFPGTGKSTVYTALTGAAAATKSVALGTVKVPDPRLDELAGLYNPRKTTAAEVVFADLPGGGGERGITAATLGQMRDLDLLAQVVRGFPGPGGESPDPVREIDDLEAELQLADLELIERRLARFAKGDKSERPGERALLEQFHGMLEQGQSLRLRPPLSEQEKAALTGTSLLSLRPVLYVLNVDEAHAQAAAPPALQQRAEAAAGLIVVLAGLIEAEIAQLEPADRAAFLADLGLESSARDRFVAAAYARLELISFFTTGPDEVKAWTIRRGTPAVEAAGKIHSDLQRGFIRADVTAYGELVSRKGDEAACKKAGVTRKEGKTYVVQDGDILTVHFNV